MPAASWAQPQTGVPFPWLDEPARQEPVLAARIAVRSSHVVPAVSTCCSGVVRL